MDYYPTKYSNKGGLKPSYKYKKKRCFWLNSCYNDEFEFGDVVGNYGISSITFYVPSFELFKCAKMKVISYIKDVETTNQIVIKLIQPYMNFDEITNTDKEANKMIYINNTGVEGMLGESIPVILRPQQINKFVIKMEQVVARFSTSVSITYVSNGNATITTLTNAYIKVNNGGSFYRLPVGEQSITYVNGAIIIKSPNLTQTFREYNLLKDIVSGVITNPLCHWRFDNGLTNLGNDFYGNYNLTRFGTPVYDTNIYTKGTGSFGLPSGNTYLRTANFYNIIGQNYSVSLWSRRTVNNTDNMIFFKFGSSSFNNQFINCRYTSTNNIQVSNGTTILLSTNTFADVNQWTHIVVIITSTLSVKLYVNGNLQINSSFANTFAGDTSFHIGTDFVSRYYRGNIDDFRFYNVALTETQALELYYGTVAIYTIPRFLLGVQVEDIDLEQDNTISPYK